MGVERGKRLDHIQLVHVIWLVFIVLLDNYPHILAIHLT
jgi:hypothetical protein